MRLLHTESLEFKEFFDDEIPEYAILSHTWEKEEVLFQDMTPITLAEQKKGFKKLKGACELARSQSFEYIWIDTCCIDKSSSAELTEAINSMYRWYKEAAVCYAYLSDVGIGMGFTYVDHLQEGVLDLVMPEFRASRWFERGWTLQELIAPPVLEFYSSSWLKLGNKKDAKVSSVVSDITGVDVHTLLGGDPAEVSIARRMFWASRRQTTRLEDRAYSLLGLFDVNMPLIYGEGDKAFRRLQEEILKVSDDQSIFAWHNPEYSYGTAVDVLAISPSDFAQSGALSRQPFFRVGREATTITSQGISCQLPLMSVTRLDTTDFKPFSEVEAILDCQLGSVPGTFPTIRLRSLPAKGQDMPKHFYRIMTDEMTKFYGYTMHGLIDGSEILGLDPTQLHRDAYTDALERNFLQWKLASIVFTRRFPKSPLDGNNQHASIPWSLSLLSDDFPPDDTGFWFLTFGAGRVNVSVMVNLVHAYPQDRWDGSSMQFRVLPIPSHLHGLGQFRIADGIFDIDVRTPVLGLDYPSRVVFNTSLMVGRYAPSRRVSPRPWCHILETTERVTTEKDAMALIEKSRETGTVKDYFKWEDETSTLVIFDREAQYPYPSEILLKATGQTKEISGVYYHVVALQAKNALEKETGLYLLNKRKLRQRGQNEGAGKAEPIRL